MRGVHTIFLITSEKQMPITMSPVSIESTFFVIPSYIELPWHTAYYLSNAY